MVSNTVLFAMTIVFSVFAAAALVVGIAALVDLQNFKDHTHSEGQTEEELAETVTDLIAAAQSQRTLKLVTQSHDIPLLDNTAFDCVIPPGLLTVATGACIRVTLKITNMSSSNEAKLELVHATGTTDVLIPWRDDSTAGAPATAYNTAYAVIYFTRPTENELVYKRFITYSSPEIDHTFEDGAAYVPPALVLDFSQQFKFQIRNEAGISSRVELAHYEFIQYY